MNHRKVALGLIALVVVAALAWVVVDRLGSGGVSTASGDTVSYSGQTLDGQAIDLSSYKGKPVVLNFWATWCGYCVQEMPELVRFAAAHPDVSVIGVNVDDSKDRAMAFVAGHGMTFPVIYDPDSAFFNQFDSEGLPTTVFLDKDLQVTDKIVGATDMAGFAAGLSSAQ